MFLSDASTAQQLERRSANVDITHGHVICCQVIFQGNTTKAICLKSSALPHTHTAWDLGIFHPPCTHLAVSGARHFAAKAADGRQQQAIGFFLACIIAGNFKNRVIEQPVSIMSSVWRKPDQIIQPWMFGHGETKATCLWLMGDDIKPLAPTNIVAGREARIHRMPPSDDRWKLRSATYQGVADAMAQQWG